MLLIFFFQLALFSIASSVDVCESAECHTLAESMISTMNTSVDPCDDFYEFVCGNYNSPYIMLDNEYVFRDYLKLFEIFKNYEPKLSNEKVAMTVFKKCQEDKQGKLSTFMNEFWENENDLTKLFIELANVDPQNAVLFQIEVTPIETYGQKNFQLTLNPNIVYTNNTLVHWKDIADQVKFMNFTEYVYQLLPEDSRSSDAFDRNLFVYTEFVNINYLVEQEGVAKIRAQLYEQWKKAFAKKISVTHTNGDCFDLNVKLFPGTMAMIFLNQTGFTQADIKRGQDMLEVLRVKSVEIISRNFYFDDLFKRRLLEKIITAKMHIAIPDMHKNQTSLDLMYNRVLKDSIEELSYIELVRSVLKMNTEETFLKFSQLQTIGFLNSALGPNANFFRYSGAISVSEHWVKFPYTHQNLPRWSVLAALGTVAAHEIGHIVDPAGIKTDAHFVKWNDIPDKYAANMNCLSQQYSQFRFPGTQQYLNGNATLIENFADIFSSKVAWELLQRDLMLNPYQPSLPGFEKYSIEKQFFMRNAHVWCRNDMNLEDIEKSRGDTHSPGMFRVRGMAINSPNFARVFQCSEGSAMNPINKCETF